MTNTPEGKGKEADDLLELLLVIPLTVAAAALYWLFKPPHVADDTPEQAVAPLNTENMQAAVAAAHAAPLIVNNTIGE